MVTYKKGQKISRKLKSVGYFEWNNQEKQKEVQEIIEKIIDVLLHRAKKDSKCVII